MTAFVLSANTNIDALASKAGGDTYDTNGFKLTVDLEKQTISGPDGVSIAFNVDPFRKECLLNGWDDIGLTLRHAEKIRAFEAQRRIEQPWLFA